jgi:hypothetical protein
MASFLTPLTGSHESAVHTLPSLMTKAVPGMHLPASPPPPHTSVPLQTVESLQVVPAGRGTPSAQHGADGGFSFAPAKQQLLVRSVVGHVLPFHVCVVHTFPSS